MSSPLPPTLLRRANPQGIGGRRRRGFVFNADLVSVSHFLDIGTAPRPRRRGRPREKEGMPEKYLEVSAWLVFAPSGSHNKGTVPRSIKMPFAADAAAGRYAVADGVTQSGFARSSARLLVAAFVADSAAPEAFVAQLPEMQTRWLQGLPASLDWLGEEKAQEGAFATFLGVTVTASADSATHDWQAVAVGDACLFHTRENQLLAAFPLERSETFTNVPRSLGSRAVIAAYWETARGSSCGRRCPATVVAGDRCLAQWCLGECEAGLPPWGEMQLLCAEEEGDVHFIAWIAGPPRTPVAAIPQ